MVSINFVVSIMKRLAIKWICQILSCYPFECFCRLYLSKYKALHYWMHLIQGARQYMLSRLSKFAVDHFLHKLILRNSLFQIKKTVQVTDIHCKVFILINQHTLYIQSCLFLYWSTSVFIVLVNCYCKCIVSWSLILYFDNS